MSAPASSHFEPIPLDAAFNADRRQLPEPLRPPSDERTAFGRQVFRGIPFELGSPDRPNVILLEEDEVQVELGGQLATYVVFVHAVEDATPGPLPGMTDFAGGLPRAGEAEGNLLGGRVSEYRLEYGDGTTTSVPVLRRFAIQQSRITWGASAFAALPTEETVVFPIASEAQQLGRVSSRPAGMAEVRHRAGRDSAEELLWLYALPNPHPDKPLARIVLSPQEARSVVYGISRTELRDHPLRRNAREKLRLELPEGAKLNALGELEEIAIDLGTVISARALRTYDRERWFAGAPDVQPDQADDAVTVEYEAHPEARLYVGSGESPVGHDLAELRADTAVAIEPARRVVRLRVIDKSSRQPVAARLHLHGEAGEYLPPRGHHRTVNPNWFEDNYAEFVNGLNQYSYIPGECEVELPLGEVFVEITRGYEIAPVRSSFVVATETDEITFELDRVLAWREQGWVTSDTHVHFLSPQTALLEGAAEGVNVVNLLASQWGEMFSSIGDFDGKSTLGARELGGDGEFLVRVGTENRMQVLGHISLLGYSGAMIQPLASGGPSESAVGDALEVTMAEWAKRCRDQDGLVVMPHAPNPQAERAADIVLGLVDAIEMMTFNPFDAQISPYGLADWYRYLNLGYRLPIVGGSDKMSAAMLLGGMRTYVQLGERPFDYENWMAAIRAGDTFVTVGPLARMTVEGLPPGSQLDLPAGGGTVNVSWQVESVSLPIEAIEVVVGGLTVEEVSVPRELSATGSAEVAIDRSTWIALRVRGSNAGRHGEIAAHTSAVQVLVNGTPPFSQPDAVAVLEQIEGTIAYVDTLATRPAARQFKQLRATLESAYNRLHQEMHRNGVFHQHNPLHDHDEHREH